MAPLGGVFPGPLCGAAEEETDGEYERHNERDDRVPGQGLVGISRQPEHGRFVVCLPNPRHRYRMSPDM